MKERLNMDDFKVYELFKTTTSIPYEKLRRTRVGTNIIEGAAIRWSGFGYLEEKDRFEDYTEEELSYAVALDNLFNLMCKSGEFYRLNDSLKCENATLFGLMSDVLYVFLKENPLVSLINILEVIRYIDGDKMLEDLKDWSYNEVVEYICSILFDCIKEKEEF